MYSDQQKPSRPSLLSAFTDHPASVNESYGQHFLFALRFSARLFGAAGAALVHAVLPFLFEKTASNMIKAMHHDLTSRH
ncbi:MAG: DUF6356 family protein [Pseudomonadota bacterium]